MPLNVGSKKLVECSVCKRCFEESRICKHQDICEKSIKLKRRPFDSFKQRIQGTVLEEHVERIRTRLQSQTSAKMNHGNWRKAHEEFISTIKAEKRNPKGLKNSDEMENREPYATSTSKRPRPAV